MKTALLLCLCFSFCASAAVYTVDAAGGGDFVTISEAIEASWHGDTLLVSPGIYTEHLYFNSRAITVTGTDPDDPAVVRSTILKGSVTFDFNEGPGSVFTGFTVLAADPDTTVETPLCTAVSSQRFPAVYGDVVVWADQRSTANGSDIYGMNLRDHEEFAVVTANGQQSNPAVSGTIVVWQDARSGSSYDIYGSNLETDAEFEICTAAGNQLEPAIYGDLVVWTDNRSGSSDIYAKNLVTNQEFAVCTATNNQYHPAVYGDLVVWADCRNGNNNIYGKYVTAGGEFTICTATNSQEYPAVDGDIVVWQDYRSGSGWDIYGKNLTTGIEVAVCLLSSNQMAPAISGDTVVWTDYRNGASNADIYGKDLAAGEEFEICTVSGNQLSPAIHGMTVVWQDEFSGEANADIFGRLPLETRGAITCCDSSPVISNNVISGFVYGILSLYSADPYVAFNILRNNYYGYVGSGRICENRISGNYGIGIQNAAGTIRNNFIENNQAGGLSDCNDVLIYQNEITSNSEFGLSGCHGTIAENTISGNHGKGLTACAGTIRDNTIESNASDGLHSCTGEIFNDSVVANSGGIVSCNAQIHDNVIGSNVSGGVIGGQGNLRDNIIFGNGCGVSNFGGTVSNNLIIANTGSGVAVCASVINNTIAENKGHGIYDCPGTVRNNIIAYNSDKGICGPAQNSYNCFWRNVSGNFQDNYAKTGDLYADPLFVTPGTWDGADWTAGDYALQSQYGRWNAAAQLWVFDLQTSPCIDKGDPADGIGFEPNPNGGRINMGFDGGTEFAAKGSTAGPDPGDPPIVLPVCIERPAMDFNDDCKVDLADFVQFSSQWMACGYADQEDCW